MNNADVFLPIATVVIMFFVIYKLMTLKHYCPYCKKKVHTTTKISGMVDFIFCDECGEQIERRVDS